MSVFSSLRNTAFDLFQNISPRESISSDAVIVLDIDEKSLSELGQWPWPRSILADLVNKTYLSASLGFDIVFAEYDRTGSNELKKQYKNNSSLLTKKDTKQSIISEYSKHDVLKNSGISDKEFDELVKYEFEDEKEIYNNLDLERLKSWSYFLELGLQPRNFTTIKSVSDRTEGFTDYLISTIQDENTNEELIVENLTKIIKGLILKK